MTTSHHPGRDIQRHRHGNRAMVLQRAYSLRKHVIKVFSETNGCAIEDETCSTFNSLWPPGLSPPRRVSALPDPAADELPPGYFKKIDSYRSSRQHESELTKLLGTRGITEPEGLASSKPHENAELSRVTTPRPLTRRSRHVKVNEATATGDWKCVGFFCLGPQYCLRHICASMIQKPAKQERFLLRPKPDNESWIELIDEFQRANF